MSLLPNRFRIHRVSRTSTANSDRDDSDDAGLPLQWRPIEANLAYALAWGAPLSILDRGDQPR
jgi:hypothetical protein